MAEKIYTQADMDAVRKLYRENTLSAVRITVDEMRSRYDPTFKCEFSFMGRPRTAHEKWMDEIGMKMFQADQELAMAKGKAAQIIAEAKASPTTANVVQMASAREIIEAGRKRRGGT
jgi:hypothetical protein